MKHKTYSTPKGVIHYWISDCMKEEKASLVFLPGLTADHRLFDKQIAYFEKKCNVFVWDAPGHALSYPFIFDFDLMDKAKWLHEILEREKIHKPILIGQSMGGYVGQAYSQLFPYQLNGFISIDSAPLQRKFVTSIEIFLLKRMEPIYRYYPWKSLLKTGSRGVATSEYGQALMKEMMMVYDGKQDWYAKLAGHGYWMLAKAMEADLPYTIHCPVLLICGKEDHAGSCVRYNKAWAKEMNYPIVWIEGAGHNANTDASEQVNQLIEKMAIEKSL